MPFTTNKGMNVPLTGSLPGTWGSDALNPNFGQLDGILGGVTNISLSAATTLVLTTSTASVTPGAGPSQSDNALIKFSGALAGNIVVRFTVPGFYIVENICTNTNSWVVQLAPVLGTGVYIAAPPGKKQQIFFDGTDVDFVNMPDPGTSLDLCGYITYPLWMQACSKIPYLIKNGAIFSSASFPALALAFGSTFGGNGVSTFGVPDEMGRVRAGYNSNGSGRLTTAVSGVNDGTMGSVGGDQRAQSHSHTFTGAAMSPHSHPFLGYNGAPGTVYPGGVNGGTPGGLSVDSVSAGTPSGTISTTSLGSSQNVQPTAVSALPMVKT